MNQDLVKLKKIRDHIVGLEMHLMTLQSDSMAVDRDVEYLTNLALVLKENIEVLKSDHIIAIASEYKKVIEEYKLVMKNLSYYALLSVKLARDYEAFTKKRDDSILEFETLKKNLDSQRKVLLFDPSKRKK